MFVEVLSNNADLEATKLLQMASTFGMSVEVGVMNTDEETARNSLVLEHRWQGAGPEHWKKGPYPSKSYVTWAFASRAAKTLQDKIVPRMIDDLIGRGIVGKQFWDQVGQEAVLVMQQTMSGVMDPGNRPSTVRQKGFDNPLIETGTMISSVSYKIKRPGEARQVEEIDSSIPPAF